MPLRTSEVIQPSSGSCASMLRLLPCNSTAREHFTPHVWSKWASLVPSAPSPDSPPLTFESPSPSQTKRWFVDSQLSERNQPSGFRDDHFRLAQDSIPLKELASLLYCPFTCMLPSNVSRLLPCACYSSTICFKLPRLEKLLYNCRIMLLPLTIFFLGD